MPDVFFFLIYLLLSIFSYTISIYYIKAKCRVNYKMQKKTMSSVWVTSHHKRFSMSFTTQATQNTVPHGDDPVSSEKFVYMHDNLINSILTQTHLKCECVKTMSNIWVLVSLTTPSGKTASVFRVSPEKGRWQVCSVCLRRKKDVHVDGRCGRQSLAWPVERVVPFRDPPQQGGQPNPPQPGQVSAEAAGPCA